MGSCLSLKCRPGLKLDPFQYYDPGTSFNPGLHFKDKQEPILSLGYHHEWSPGAHTLIFGSRLTDRFTISNAFDQVLLVGKFQGRVLGVRATAIEQEYRSNLDIYSAEIQQLWQTPFLLTIVGARFQAGDFRTHNFLFHPYELAGVFADVPALQDFSSDFERLSAYAYEEIGRASCRERV